MAHPKREEILNIEGPPGESIFRRPLIWLFPFDRTAEFQRELDEYWAHYKDLADERAVVLAGALCIEDCLDRIIKAFFPGSRDFSFSLKIDLVRACKLIPTRILNHCDLVRKIRNDFAHELECGTFSEYESLSSECSRNIQAVDQAIQSYDSHHDFSVPRRKRFEHLVSFVCVALKMYTIHVEGLRTFLDSADFMKSLKDFKEKK